MVKSEGTNAKSQQILKALHKPSSRETSIILKMKDKLCFPCDQVKSPVYNLHSNTGCQYTKVVT